ncbi:hypothetical protein [Alloyangia pacifica]|uniref:hypothetical protein n=1 Tax=Alloyangia pacifica TaxID=311180 RepID=UPI001CFD2CB0|nr:hypothetical protein [Alloyangia pacifica]
MNKPLLAILLLASGAAQAEGESAADCAALWQGVALEAADNPNLSGSPESASLLARQFSVTAASEGLSGPPLRRAILDALPGYRLLYRGVIAGDAESQEAFDALSEACSGLLAQS